jgi:phage nucleotide-binding protein
MRGLGFLIYGAEGIGKTSFASQFPKKLLMLGIKETGYQDLEEAGEVPDGIDFEYVTEWTHFLKVMKEADDYRTVVIDGISGLQQILFDFVRRTMYSNDTQKFTAYYSGPRQSAPLVFMEIETVFESLRASGTNVILLGHMKTEQVPNALGQAYSTHAPDMDEAVRGILTKWAQAILFMNLDVSFEGKHSNKKGGVADDKNSRLMYTTKAPGHWAKNRIGLPDYIGLGGSPSEAYQNFVRVLKPQYKEHLNG